MKKIIKTLLVVMIIAMVVMAFAGCEKDPCKDGHTLEAIAEKLATCTEDGYSSGVVCSVCGYVERSSFKLDAKGHKWVDADCDTPKTCSVCAATEGEALGHTLADVAEVPATCTKVGYTAHKACACGYTEGKEEISTIAHALADVEGKAATCTEAGFTAYKDCENCDYIEGKEEIEALGHTWSDATCTEPQKCGCGETQGEALGHTHEAVVTDPTCTEAGYTTHTCSACGDSYKDSEVDATGHAYADGACSVCGEKDPDYANPYAADFDAIALPSSKPNGDSSYTATYTTANGWVTTNSAIQSGGSTVSNPQFPVIGPDNTHRAVCLNGKVGAAGKITSPTLTGGISKFTMEYTKMFTDTKLSVTVTITDLTTGAVYTQVVEREEDKDTKYVVWTYEWVLETPIAGDFTIEVVNNCPTGSTSNKDRMTVLSIEWTPNTAAEKLDPETFAFADYVVSGELGGGTSVREMGENITFTISSGWITGDTGRIYKSAYATIESEVALDSVVINAGYKDSSFNVYVSEDGENWVLLGNYTYTVAYSDVTIEFEAPTKYVKIDAVNQQIRMKSITVVYA